MKNKKTIKLLGLLLATPLLLMAQSVKKQPATLPLDPAVRFGHLPNGFTYYIRHNEEPKHRVTMYMVNKAGSILEDEDQRGLAHFTEHMSFNGTVHFPHNELIDYLQKSGVRYGADVNAYTSFDETVYELPLPADKPDILAKGILIMHDLSQSATFDPVEIDKERGVVLEEKRLGKGARERMSRHYYPVILNRSRYAMRLPIGVDTVLDNFKPKTIERYYHDWYRPDLQALIIVGDINADSLERVVRAKFSDLKNPVKERPRVKYQVPLNNKNQYIALSDKEMTVIQAEVLIKQPEKSLKTAEDFRNHMMRSFFSQMLSNRMSELLRQSNPPFLQASGGIIPFIGDLDAFDAVVVAKPHELESGFKVMWREIERAKRFGFTPTELAREKATYLSNTEAQLKEKDKTNNQVFIGAYLRNFLKGNASPGIDREYQMVKANLAGINLQEVNALSAAWIKSVNRDILVFSAEKDKAELPDEVTVNAWMRSVEQEKLQPYHDETSNLPMLSNAPVNKGSIVAETHDKLLHTVTLTLNNGVKILLKPTDFKNDEIAFGAFSPGGTSVASDAAYQSAASAASLINSSGVGNYNETQLGKAMAGKRMIVEPYINDRNQGFRGLAEPQNIETALQLIYGYFAEPRKDTAIFNSMIARNKASLAHRWDNPGTVFADSVRAIAGNYNIRRTGPSLKKIDQINLDKAYAFYQQQFSDASGFTFVFVGNIDTTAIKPLLEKYLGSLPSTYSHRNYRDLGIHPPYGQVIRTIYKGLEPSATVLLAYTGPFEYNEENRIRMNALKEALQIRVIERLREDESGVYSPRVSISTDKYPNGQYSLEIDFNCAPQNVEKLIASATDEVNKIRTNGPLDENLNKWRAEDKALRETQLKTNNFWLSYLVNQLENEEGLDQVYQYDNIRDKVTPGDLKKTANKYLSGDNFIRVLLPETK